MVWGSRIVEKKRERNQDFFKGKIAFKNKVVL